MRAAKQQEAERYAQANGKTFAQHVSANAYPLMSGNSFTYSTTPTTATSYTAANLGLSTT